MSAAAAPATGVATPHPRRRIVSLDWSRGVAVLLNLSVIAVLPPVPDQLRHAPWEGVRLMDLVFPLFVTLAGAGLAFAYARRVDVWVVLRRSAVLWWCGLLYNGILLDWPPVTEFRLMGPLQLYAVLVPVVAIASTRLSTGRQWSIAVAAVTVITTMLHLVWSAACGGLTPECNPSRGIDLPLLGDHAYRSGSAGFDPEGLVALTGASITMGVGLLAGVQVRQARNTPGARHRVTTQLVALAVACALGAFALQAMGVPLVKRVWTPSFALLTAVPGILLLAGAHAVLDGRREASSAVEPGLGVSAAVALGRNALLGYFGSHAVIHWLRAGDVSLADRLVEFGGGADTGRWLFGLVFVSFWVVLCMVLARFRIYIRP